MRVRVRLDRMRVRRRQDRLPAGRRHLLAASDQERTFKRCRYFTHDAMAMAMEIEDELNDDGTTKDGCVDITPITQADPDRKCPTRWWNWDELGLLLLVVLLPVCFCCCVGLGICLCCRKRKAKARKKRQNLPPPTA